MHTAWTLRSLLATASLVILSACSTTANNELAALDPPAAASEDAAPRIAEGTEARFCPKVSIREGTAIIEKKEGEAVDYVASIADAKRDCRIVDGKLKIVVGVEGRVMPGRAAKNRNVELPIRVAVVGNDGVIYSELGQRTVPVQKGGTAQNFRYVDEEILLEPMAGGVVIYTGFDEGPPKRG
ncbi:hypothetical protein [Jiella marina]|uniref:hypothetical protein n=1 Tax=Jiella sp. LLJ827 TaxID=2917712 RepID=UPI00210148AD|nr:hypothetical protein [Jiella sp. LLJ827]MCQ0989153.1 hypothetical protein [Jiella sp. LLJ827]